MMQAYFALAVSLFLMSGPAVGQTSACAKLIKLLPVSIQKFNIEKCDTPKNSQVVLSVSVRIPGAQIGSLSQTLEQKFGLRPLRFVCCHYETQPVNLPLPDTFKLEKPVPIGAFRSATITLWAPAFDENDNSGPHPLGAIDGILTVTIADV